MLRPSLRSKTIRRLSASHERPAAAMIAIMGSYFAACPPRSSSLFAELIRQAFWILQ
jgi:hypothetical protein